jgi:hypothetical protein
MGSLKPSGRRKQVPWITDLKLTEGSRAVRTLTVPISSLALEL